MIAPGAIIDCETYNNNATVFAAGCNGASISGLKIMRANYPITHFITGATITLINVTLDYNNNGIQMGLSAVLNIAASKVCIENGRYYGQISNVNLQCIMMSTAASLTLSDSILDKCGMNNPQRGAGIRALTGTITVCL